MNVTELIRLIILVLFLWTLVRLFACLTSLGLSPCPVLFLFNLFFYVRGIWWTTRIPIERQLYFLK
jgi:hypothetical protein